MSHDPWECTFAPPLGVTDNPLDPHDSMEDRTRLPMAFTQEAADWLSDAGRAIFAQGTSDGHSKAQENAYAALAMPDQLSSPFGLDSAQPTIKLADVRAGPRLDTDETDGDLPNMTAVIHALTLHRELITRNQMIYLIVDNRKPEAVPHWPAFAAWWASRRCLVGPRKKQLMCSGFVQMTPPAFIRFPIIGQEFLSWRLHVSCTPNSTLRSLTTTVCLSHSLKC